MKKERLTEDQKEKAIDMATRLGENASQQEIDNIDKNLGKFKGELPPP